ncbi:MAG: hypothetical protein IPG07_04000 [Crocinitomicaceae bacterium]|nr:hypothetical protein [Crocinitomicaceae bacterium]
MPIVQSILLSILILFGVKAIAQSDTLNKTNADGARYGWWIVYLDDNLEAVKDSADATHYHYTIYSGSITITTWGHAQNTRYFPCK